MRRRRLFVAYGILAVSWIPVFHAFATDTTVDQRYRTLSMVTLLVVGVFHLLTWRCPRCSKYLQLDLFARHCANCGTKLSSD